jgi:hypothetical protein
MGRAVVTLGLILFVSGFPASSQTFDSESFIQRLNRALEQEGVTLSQSDNAAPLDDVQTTNRAPEIRFDVPEFGFAAVSPNGSVQDVFGPSAPAVLGSDGEIQGIRGYQADGGVTFEVIGADQYTSYVTSAANAQLDEGFQRAIQMMKEATVYVASQLCANPARPSEITVSVSADFKLVFGASTGTTAKWILSETCNR